MLSPFAPSLTRQLCIQFCKLRLRSISERAKGRGECRQLKRDVDVGIAEFADIDTPLTRSLLRPNRNGSIAPDRRTSGTGRDGSDSAISGTIIRRRLFLRDRTRFASHDTSAKGQKLSSARCQPAKNCRSAASVSCGASSGRKCPQSSASPCTRPLDFSRQHASTSNWRPTVPRLPHKTSMGATTRCDARSSVRSCSRSMVAAAR